MSGRPNSATTHERSTGRGRDAIEWGLTAGAILLIVVLQLMAYFGRNELLSLAANLSTVLLTFLVSYVITRYFAEKAARAELFDLGQASGEETALLSVQLQQLAEEVDDFTPEDERAQLYLATISSQLQKLASQADLTFHNIQRMAGLDISIPALRAEVQATIQHGIRQETVPCPHCRAENHVCRSVPRLTQARPQGVQPVGSHSRPTGYRTRASRSCTLMSTKSVARMQSAVIRSS